MTEKKTALNFSTMQLGDVNRFTMYIPDYSKFNKPKKGRENTDTCQTDRPGETA